MDDNDFSEIMNNTKNLTLRQIFRLMTNITYKSILVFIATFLTITGSAYVAGQASIKQEAAVMLQSPFSMRITLDSEIHDFNNLTLIEDPMLLSTSSDTMMLSLKQIQSAFDIVQVGQIVARVNREDALPIWKWLFSSIDVKSAYAQAEKIFKWNGHKNDFKFKEKHKSNSTINRYYTDECILEYKVDNNRRSIPESFRWIKRTH